jgi:TRAP-type mannitol/chloroaromatic compound transport system substrate-binding protein
LQVLDAVQNNTVEMGHTASYYYVGKDMTFGLDCTVPFGMNARQQNAWMTHSGGLELLRAFFKDYNVYNIPAGNTGAQMGGWYRKEIKTLDDLKGLKFRIGSGMAGAILAKLGVVPQTIPGGDIYPALEKGTIDAAEWVGPDDDEKLGFYKIAKYYYTPGWWEGQAQLSAYVNLGEWEKLSKSYQAILTAACAEANGWMVGKYDTDNVAALRRLIANGTQLRPFSKEILDACYSAAQEFYTETAAKNAKFKTVYEPWRKFLDDEHQWFRVVEQQFDSYMLSVKKSRARRLDRSKRFARHCPGPAGLLMRSTRLWSGHGTPGCDPRRIGVHRALRRQAAGRARRCRRRWRAQGRRCQVPETEGRCRPGRARQHRDRRR